MTHESEDDHIRELAALPSGLPDDVPVIVTAGHDRVLDDPDTWHFSSAREAHEWVLQQYNSGNFDPYGCWVRYSRVKTP